VLPWSRPSRVAAPRLRGGSAWAFTELATLKLEPVVNDKGWVFPVAPPGTQASVFAVYDASEQIQYIGFSKELRNSLRTLLGRRPELCVSYKALHYAVLDQGDMVKQRSAWIAELGTAPPGNSDAAETAAWQAARVLGSPDEAAKAFDALQAALRARGVTEGLEADTNALKDGKLDLAPSLCNTVAALEGDAARRGAGAVPPQTVVAKFPGAAAKGRHEEVGFTIFFPFAFRTRGGHMLDCVVTPADGSAVTTHRVIVGAPYTRASGGTPEELVAHAIAFLMHLKIPMQTDGILGVGTFPVNYFNVSLIDQWYPEFGARHGLPGAETCWRFNKLNSYGAEAERVDSLMLGPGHMSTREEPVSAARF